MGVLSKCVVAVTGTLPAGPINIKKWVDAHGGKWAARVNRNVTHLIASRDAWKKVTDPVMKAAELNIYIVSYDWLEDSLQIKRRLSEKKYTWESIKSDKKRKRQLKKLGTMADGKKFLEGCQKIRELTGSGMSVKLPQEPKPKKSRSFFFADQINTPYMSAKDDLIGRRAERKAKEAAEKAAKAAKKPGSAQAPIEIEDEAPDPDCISLAPLPTPPSSVSPVRLSSKTASPASSTFATKAPTSPQPQAKKPSLKDLYHYYLDSTGFEYNITLLRNDPALNTITRYKLSVLESHTTPHSYCTFAQYVPPGGNSPPENAEAARLQKLATPESPVAAQPYKTLLCPMDSPFSTAWRAFRHAFRDMTLLSWEERFDEDKSVQKARAKRLDIEPYTYARPSLGLPVGLRVQEAGLKQGGSQLVILGDAEDGYARNEWNLPGLEEMLGRGIVGSSIQRDIATQREREEAEHRRKEAKDEAERKKKGAEKVKKPNYNKPLFNCATGKPKTDAHGRWTSAGQRPTHAGGYGGMVKKARAFLRDRE
ncbi:hypothetical protein EK21DRAFT_80161 [Setomelanomma holmii]|uniref:BRCT domain-containing protein n=1 Tax=Setomelanomma holmii TaxID=210430 RepID=A0A9P4LH14_9PLEO|nr:hypothetical protein EK21DRAFT_80161 [Setomelanomma holmii]